MIYPLLALLLTQVSVSSSGIDVTSLDVEKVLTPITTWSSSLFNVIVTFAGVFIVIFFVKLLLGYLKLGK